MDCKREWPTFVCDGCGRKAILTYDEYEVRGEGRRLCTKCARKILKTERVFKEHVPACAEMEHHLVFYSTWEDLERQLRKNNPNMTDHLIGCSDVTERTAMLLEVFKSGKKVEWWVLGTAYNIPGEPPWPHWKKVVRKLGGQA